MEFKNSLDLERLREDTDPKEICARIGMKMYPKGTRTFIICPGHRARLGKADSNPTNAVLTKHGYHCFACGCSVSTADMICEFLGCGLSDAFKIMAETVGGEEFYRANGEKKLFTLSEEEVKALKLDRQYDSALPLSTFLNSSAKLAKAMLKERAEEMIREYRKVLEEYSSSDGAYALYEYARITAEKRMKVLETASERITVCKRLLKRL